MVVEISSGKLEGIVKDGFSVFRGVPFATAPVGARRFGPPLPVVPWTGVRMADTWGPICPQAPLVGALAYETGPQSEDCLSLNVFTPGCDGARRPVMVWIHGGSFVSGSGSTPMYAGRRLAQRGDLVVVTINYRLGALGFLAHEDLRDPETGIIGNAGLLDQIAALGWVRDNIEAFGGDRSQVTVFGESAGAACIVSLLACPAASGLFGAAAIQSGADFTRTLDAASVSAEKVAAEAGVSVAGLRDVPFDALVAAQSRAYSPIEGRAPGFTPVVDGTTLDAVPTAAIAEGASASVATILGTNLEEIRLWLMLDPSSAGMDEQGARAALAEFLGGDALVTAALETYGKARADRGDSVAPLDLITAVGSDVVFRIPTINIAAAKAGHNPDTWCYLFTFPSPLMGAAHAVEIPFVFGTHELKGAEAFLGASPDIPGISQEMQAAWIGLARDRDPGSAWPRYDTVRRATRVLGPGPAVVDAPMETERSFWDSAR